MITVFLSQFLHRKPADERPHRRGSRRGVLVLAAAALSAPLLLLQDTAAQNTETFGDPAQADVFHGDCRAPEPGDAPTIPRAKALILDGRYQEAERVLACVVLSPETETDIHFLRGRIAEATGDLATAAQEYRAILAKRPNLLRVRLELARLLFLMQEDSAARHHFELALGGGLPEAVEENVLRFLAAIRQRQRVRAHVSVGIVPDSNVNTATDQSQVALFGLPFDLADDATRESGVGISLRGSVDFRQPLTEQTAFEAGAGLRRIEHSSREFDDMSLHGFAGLRRSFTGGDLGARATISHQWFGGRAIYYGSGGELDIGGRPQPRLDLRLFAGGEAREYDEEAFLDGFLVSLRGQARYNLSTDSLVGLDLGIAREDTRDPAFTNTQPFLGLRFFKAFPVGLSVSFGPLVGLRKFDEPLAAFGETRRDILLRLQLETVLQKEIAFGFAPLFSYTYTYNDSNIDLFSYRRHQFEIGLTKRF